MSEKKKTLKINEKHLPFIAAFLQAVLFSFAGFVYFEWIGVLIGGMAGSVVNLAIAIAASKITTIAQGRKPLAWVSLILLMVLSPIAVGPAAYLSLDVVTDNTWRNILAAVWAILPDASVLLTGAIVGKSLTANETDNKNDGKKSGKWKTNQKPNRKPMTDSDLLSYVDQYPTASHEDIAKHFERTRSAISQRLKSIKERSISVSNQNPESRR
jgi:hypothetical protein